MNRHRWLLAPFLFLAATGTVASEKDSEPEIEEVVVEASRAELKAVDIF